jgi:predicted nuclease with TOPRIM domain
MTQETTEFLMLRVKALEERVKELEHENYRLSEKNKAQAESLKFYKKVHKPFDTKVKDFELPIDSVMHKGRRL